MTMTLTDDDLTAIAWRLEPIIVARLEPIQLGVAALTAMCEPVDKGLPTEHSRWQASALEMAPGLSQQDVRDASKLEPTAGSPAAGSIDQHLDDLLSALTTLDGLVDAIKARTDRLGTAGVTVSSPMSSSGDEVEVYQGDDYSNSDSRALEWTNASGTWPDLTSATITFAVRAPSGSSFTATGSVVTPIGAGQKVRVELTAAQSALLVEYPTPSDYRVRATLASGRKATLVRGDLTVIVDIIG